MTEYPRLAIGIPSNGEIRSETVVCLVHALFQTPMSGLGLTFPTGCLIHENRCAIAEEACIGNYDYLLFIDADMVFPPDAINTLLSHKKHVIGANYHKRGKLPVENTVVDESGSPIVKLPSEPFKCGGVATGFLLINTAVFNVIDMPWFFYKSLTGNSFQGEDYWFCEKVKSKGLEVWCDPTIEVKHIGTYQY